MGGMVCATAAASAALTATTLVGVTATWLSRAVAFCQVAEKAGVQVEMQLWTTGAYDGILILNAASEVKALNAIARLVATGNVSTETLQAFDAKEFTAIVGQ
jgi:uncharacterized protein with GYD domain